MRLTSTLSLLTMAAGVVFDDYRLAHAVGELLSDQPRQNISRPPGSVQ